MTRPRTRERELDRIAEAGREAGREAPPLSAEALADLSKLFGFRLRTPHQADRRLVVDPPAGTDRLNDDAVESAE